MCFEQQQYQQQQYQPQQNDQQKKINKNTKNTPILLHTISAHSRLLQKTCTSYSGIFS